MLITEMTGLLRLEALQTAAEVLLPEGWRKEKRGIFLWHEGERQGEGWLEGPDDRSSCIALYCCCTAASA